MKTTTLILLLLLGIRTFSQTSERPNIIFIVLDDLNDYVQGYGGHPQVATKYIKTIAKSGITFTNTYCSAPVCSPSRTSFLTGKDIYYTQNYTNSKCKPFRSYFTEANGNEEVYTLPEYLKDSGGYFTFNIGKIFDCFGTDYDFDFSAADNCSRSLSWNKYISLGYTENPDVIDYGDLNNSGVGEMRVSAIPNSLETSTHDYIAVDSALNFLNALEAGVDNTCGKPFALFLGLRKPHAPLFIPEKYFLPYYDIDYTEDDFVIPYNSSGTTAYNGVVMPPQPDVKFQDYYDLPDGGMAQWLANFGGVEDSILDYFGGIALPSMGDTLTDEEKTEILEESVRANLVMGYLAGIRFVDAQIGRLYKNLKAHPEILSNTIIVIISDNGFHLGQKRHWSKATSWESSLRVPMIISDYRTPVKKTVNSQVTLLDLFPTICDLVNVSPPLFSDSTPYLDGLSLVPLMTSPGMIWNHPVVSAFKSIKGNPLGCFPQYSVKDNQYHYLRYQSNGINAGGPCHESESTFEEELYNIGLNREIDPHEWNNLINDSSYTAIRDYLKEYLPGGSMYLIRAVSPEISNNDYPCFFGYHDIITATANTPEGLPVNSIYTWRIAKEKAIQTGENFSASVESIDPAYLDDNGKLAVILSVKDTITGNITGINRLEFFTGIANEPVASFSPVIDQQGILHMRCDVTGAYSNLIWNYGDGAIEYGKYPSDHRYAASGIYNVSLKIIYGNSGCEKTYEKKIEIMPSQTGGSALLIAYPDPASEFCIIYLPEAAINPVISVTDIYGRTVKSYVSSEDNGSAVRIETNALAGGLYNIFIGIENRKYNARIVVAH